MAIILQDYFIDSKNSLVSAKGNLDGTIVTVYYKTDDPVVAGEKFLEAFRQWPGSREPGLWYYDGTDFINAGIRPYPYYEFDFESLSWKDTRTIEEISAGVVSLRNQKLQESDWTQLADIPEETKNKWEPYRQALRDITAQSGFPTDVVWPTPPQ